MPSSFRLSAISTSRLGPWKSAAITEKRQQDCETKSVRAMLIHHQGKNVLASMPNDHPRQ